jgi:hypothetical protein
MWVDPFANEAAVEIPSLYRAGQLAGQHAFPTRFRAESLAESLPLRKVGITWKEAPN